MRLLELSALALAVETAHAYLDTSPFFLFSTSDFLVSTSQLTTAGSVTSSISLALSECPSNLYIVISQPSVSGADFSQQHTPGLYQRISSHADHSSIRSSASVKDVVGQINTQQWREVLESRCTKWSQTVSLSDLSRIELNAGPGLLNVDMPALGGTGERRKETMRRNDAQLSSLFEYVKYKNYTVLYTTSPVSLAKSTPEEGSLEYTMEDKLPVPLDVMHVDLKRDLSRREGEKVYENQTMVEGPLFEKYQFLSPGLFMGFTVGLILLSILYVGISALSSLQVTYAAFDKEVVQAAIKSNK